jgi:hypothetical protein
MSLCQLTLRLLPPPPRGSKCRGVGALPKYTQSITRAKRYLNDLGLFIGTVSSSDYKRRGADKSLAFLLFLFAAQPKELFFDGLKTLEQRSHKCVELRGEYVE